MPGRFVYSLLGKSKLILGFFWAIYFALNSQKPPTGKIGKGGVETPWGSHFLGVFLGGGIEKAFGQGGTS